MSGFNPARSGAVYSGYWAEKELFSAAPNGTAPELQQAQHFGDGRTDPIKRDNFRHVTPTAQPRQLARPEGLFAAHRLVELGQTAHHTQVGHRYRGFGRWRLRPGKHRRPPEHSAAQRSSAAAK